MTDVLTPEERAQLEPAAARVRQAQEHRQHEARRRAGTVPDVPLQTWLAGKAAAAAAEAKARLQVSFALAPGTSVPERLEAARVAIAALPHQLAAYAAIPGNPKRFQRRVSRSVVEVARDLVEAFEAPRGPRATRGTPASYVQQEDLEDLVPDGWGSSWPLESSRLGRRAGVAPLAVPLLCLLTWCSALRPPASDGELRCGAGLQVSLGWLARKLGCSTSWVKVLCNRLDPFAAHRREVQAVGRENRGRRRRGEQLLEEPKEPRGTPLIHRYRRLRRYVDVPQRDGARRAAWVDAGGRPHWWVDVRGVCYVTDFGRRVLVRRAELHHRPRPGSPPRLRTNGFAVDADTRLRSMRLRLAARLGDQANFESEQYENTGAPAG